MIKFYFVSVFTLLFFAGFSQNYSYLNASTANEDEYPTDKDTNIYMFQDNRLTKTDKNFNIIWTNTYSGISFSNLLLSKTGSIYFIGGSGSSKIYFGKINPNGSLSWIKSTQNINAVLSGTNSVNLTFNAASIFLDRNNQLVITGGSSSGTEGYLLKTDTNGVPVKFKSFYLSMGCMDRLTMVEDSAGYYKLFGYGFTGLPGYSFVLHTYCDITDAFTGVVYFNLSNLYNISSEIRRSKFNSGFYVSMSADIISGPTVHGVLKFSTKGTLKWLKSVSAGLIYSKSITESNNGDLLYSMHTPYTPYKSLITKIDSNGVAATAGMVILNNYPAASFQFPMNNAQVIHDNNYYFDIWRYNFPVNPLTIQKFNSSFTFSCSSNISIANGANFFVGGGFTNTPVPDPVTSFTVPSFSSTMSTSPFSISTNFCTVLKTGEEMSAENGLSIYPNPSDQNIYIKTSGQYLHTAEIYDVNGKKVKGIVDGSLIEVADLPEGIYFLRIKTDKGEFNKKFIKE